MEKKSKKPKAKKPKKIIDLYPGLRESIRGGLDVDIFEVKEFLINLCEQKDLPAIFLYLDEKDVPRYTITRQCQDDPKLNAQMRVALNDVSYGIAEMTDAIVFEPDDNI